MVLLNLKTFLSSAINFGLNVNKKVNIQLKGGFYMTRNQIDYYKAVETERSNRMNEVLTSTRDAESKRHNLATEQETNRSNLANESIRRESNLIAWTNTANQAEQIRNQNEYWQGQLANQSAANAETARANRAQEQLKQEQQLMQNAYNRGLLANQKDYNTGYLEELSRHNQAQEETANFSAHWNAIYGQQQNIIAREKNDLIQASNDIAKMEAETNAERAGYQNAESVSRTVSNYAGVVTNLISTAASAFQNVARGAGDIVYAIGGLA